MTTMTMVIMSITKVPVITAITTLGEAQRHAGLPSQLGSLPISVLQAHPDMQDEDRVLGNMLYI
jgi:hypothetical protein